MDRGTDDFAGAERHEEGLDLAAQLEAVRRRIWPMLAVFVTVLVTATAVALLWPPTYRSMGTILIEQQEVPLDFVRSAVTSFADERLEVISQRVMTSTNLLDIIEKHNLYADERGQMTREQLVERMRQNVQRDMISADVIDPRGGGARKATIAFAVGYESRSPELAARVANDLITLYLQKNIETRKQLAAGTTEFLPKNPRSCACASPRSSSASPTSRSAITSGCPSSRRPMPRCSKAWRPKCATWTAASRRSTSRSPFSTRSSPRSSRTCP